MLVLVLLISTLIGRSIGLPCPSGCTCEPKMVRCINVHLSAIPAVSSDTTKLDLRYNQIRTLPSNAFAELPNLHTIFLSENRIGLIHDEAFSGLSALKHLYLNNNRISKISPTAFQGLEQLQNLYLENNDIWEFDPKTFNNLPHLERLYLSNNKIIIIPEGSFENLVQLKRLRLELNPIDCDCGVHTFFRLHKTTESRARIMLTCSSPPEIYNKTFDELQDADFHCKKPLITKEPDDIEIIPGEEVELPCTATGDPIPEVVWIQNANIVDQVSPRMQILENGSLKIVQTTSEDGGIYECKAINALGEARSRPVRMVVYNNSGGHQRIQRPSFQLQPGNLKVTTNDPIILHCIAVGSPTPQIHWYFNDRKISQSTIRSQIHTNGSLIIESPDESDAGDYKCEASNRLGTIYSSSRVEITEVPKFIREPESQKVMSGATIILECDAESNPEPRIWWKRNGTVLTSSSAGVNRIKFGDGNTELEIQHIKESDSGKYVCVAENENGMAEAVAEIIVENSWGPPRLIVEPYNMDVLPDTTIEIPCKGAGDPAPQVKWRKDGRTVTSEGRIRIGTTGSLYIKNVTATDAGRYECSLHNQNGRATAAGLVTVKNNDVLSPGDRYVHIAYEEATNDIDLAVNHTMEMLFSNKSGQAKNHGDLFRLFRYPNAAARNLARAAEIYERTLVKIRKYIDNGANLTMNSTDYQYKELLSREHLALVTELSGCAAHTRHPNCTDMCYHSKYRAIDGTCNNLNNPTWGSALSAFRRINRPIYENGFSMPIGWTKGKLYHGFQKPSARLISTSLISTKEITSDVVITHMVMQWGQFLDHDLDHALPSVSSESWDGVDCKKTCNYAAPCYPIDVPPNDPRVKNRRCIDLVRSSAVCGSGMTSVFFDSVQPREQINQLTSYIDASQVYGYSEEFSIELRNLTTEGGRLRTGVQFPKQKEMLPFAAPQDGIDCRRNVEESSVNCFVAGDIRVNEQIGLLATHIIWMREHNRIADKLKEINPHWDGDTLYHEARKIVGAQMQHITFKHWLPIVLGPEGVRMLGEYRGYNASINPSISNEFATAALRFGHSLINPILHRLNSSYEPIPEGHLQLHKAFFSPWRLVYEGGVDPLMRGMINTPAKLKMPEQNLNSELTEKLFHNSHAVALDLAAINIQRAREHGIPEYNQYRKFCNLPMAETFDDLKNEISKAEVRRKLEELYGHPSNIDLWVGGILEDQVEGGKVGPLFRCILVEQFRRLRDGDRFYYENPSVFLPEQLAQIQQANLGRVLCDNGDNITEATDNIFILPNQQGGYKPCSEISGANLYFWQECDSCTALPPLLKSYVPQTYRQKRSLDNREIHNLADSPIFEDDFLDINEERVSGLEDLISSFQKELKKMKKKVKKLEDSCNGENNNNKHPHHHCQDASGNRRLNNEIWNQDECTKCQCKHPQVTCITEHCGQVTCPNNVQPVKYPGDCCSQCPNSNSVSTTEPLSVSA